MLNLNTYLQEVKDTLDHLSRGDIQGVIKMLSRAYTEEQQVFIIGNGGSAATASHFACDLTKSTIRAGRNRFRAIALTDNVPLITAWANDTSYESVFSEQLANLMNEGDVLIAISGSGNSANILRAVQEAKERGAATIGFSGFNGGKLKDIVDLCVVVPNYCMAQIEDVHLILEHLISTCLGEVISNESGFSRPGWCNQREPARSRQELGGVPVSTGSR
jgi:D-sedoheptulose 7-phosphate isomerase